MIIKNKKQYEHALDLGSQESLKWHIEYIQRLWQIK